MYKEIKPEPLIYYFGGQSIENDTNIALFGPFRGEDTMIGVRLDDCYATKEELIQADKDFHEEIKRADAAKIAEYKEQWKTKKDLKQAITRYNIQHHGSLSYSDEIFEKAAIERVNELYKKTFRWFSDLCDII